MQIDALWGVVIGGAIATFAPIVVEILRGNRESDIDDRKRANDRQIERDRIQRDTLLDLQGAFTEWMRVVVQVHMVQYKGVVETGVLPRTGDELSEAEMATGRRLRYLTERVLDDSLRERLNGITSQAAGNTTSYVMRGAVVTPERLDEDWRAVAFSGSEAMVHIGEVLRRYL